MRRTRRSAWGRTSARVCFSTLGHCRPPWQVRGAIVAGSYSHDRLHVGFRAHDVNIFTITKRLEFIATPHGSVENRPCSHQGSSLS